MEYQLKKKQILDTVEYSNLLTFALTENKLEKNFKSLVQAIMLNQAQNQQTKEDLKDLSDSHMKEFSHLKDRISALENKLTDKGSGNSTTSEKRVSMTKQQNIEEKEKTSIHSEAISAPNVQLNYVDSQPDSQTSLQNKQQNGKRDEKKYDQMLEDLRKQIQALKEDRDNSKDMEKIIRDLKDNINGVRAQLLALNQKQEREKTSNKRVSIKNNIIDKKESAKEIKKSSNNLSKKDLPRQSTKNLISPPSNKIIQQSQSLYENANTEGLGGDNMNLQEEINQLKEEFEREINGLHIEINTIKICLEEAREQNNQLRRKQTRFGVQIEDLQKNAKKMQTKLDEDNENYEKQLKEIKMQLLNINTSPVKEGEIKKSRKIIESKELSPNYNSQINDKISKLQAVIQGLVTQSQFKRFKNQVQDKLDSLETQDERIKKETKDDLQAINDLLDIKDEEIANIQKQIDELKENMHDSSCQCERKNNIAMSRVEQLKKGLQQLKEDLQFYKSMNQMMNEVSSPKVLKEHTANTNSGSEKMQPAGDQLNGEELKKYFNRKMHDQRTFLLGQIRDLQKKLNEKNNFQKDIVGIWDKFNEINLFLGKKANEEDIRKNLNFLEKKIAAIMNRMSSNDENTEDARIAKTNWFCLSCDKNLSNYQGKIGKHVAWDSMPIKAQYAKFYQKDDKKSLPLLKR